MAKPTQQPRRRPSPPSPSSQHPSSETNAQSSLYSYTSSDGEESRTATYSSSSSSPYYSRTGSFDPSGTSLYSVPHSTYVPVAPLPIFRGSPDECPVLHLTRFARVCTANNASTPEMAAKIFPVTLDGEAALWYDLSVEPDQCLSWEEIKSMFLGAYQRPDLSREELMSLKQARNERVTTFYLRMQWILRKWPQHGIPVDILRGIFVDGLRDEVKEWVVLQRPSTLEEAFRFASTWEDARRCSRTTRDEQRRTGRCGFCNVSGHEEKTCELRRRMREMWVRIKEEGLLSRSTVSTSSTTTFKADDKIGATSQQQCSCRKHQCWKRLERSPSVAVLERPQPPPPPPPPPTSGC